MTAEGLAFLAAVREKPDDDTVRLAFADWLEDNGDPDRPAFVRGSIAGRVPGGVWTPTFGGNETSVGQTCGWWWQCRSGADGWPLDGENDGRGPSGVPWHDVIRFWLPPPNSTPGDLSLVVRRGFVDEVRLPAAAFIAAVARELFAAHPVTKVEFAGAVRGGTVFRGDGDGDIPAWLWEALRLPRCVTREPAHAGAGTHLHLPGSSYLSGVAVDWGRALTGLPRLEVVP